MEILEMLLGKDYMPTTNERLMLIAFNWVICADENSDDVKMDAPKSMLTTDAMGDIKFAFTRIMSLTEKVDIEEKIIDITLKDGLGDVHINIIDRETVYVLFPNGEELDGEYPVGGEHLELFHAFGAYGKKIKANQTLAGLKQISEQITDSEQRERLKKITQDIAAVLLDTSEG